MPDARVAPLADRAIRSAGHVRFGVAFPLSLERRVRSSLARNHVPALQFVYQLYRYCNVEPTMTFAMHNTPNNTPNRARVCAFFAADVGLWLAHEGIGQSQSTRLAKAGVGTTQ